MTHDLKMTAPLSQEQYHSYYSEYFPRLCSVLRLVKTVCSASNLLQGKTGSVLQTSVCMSNRLNSAAVLLCSIFILDVFKKNYLNLHLILLTHFSNDVLSFSDYQGYQMCSGNVEERCGRCTSTTTKIFPFLSKTSKLGFVTL